MVNSIAAAHHALLAKRKWQARTTIISGASIHQITVRFHLRKKPICSSRFYRCERIIRVAMPRRFIRPDDAHYGFMMRHCELSERQLYLQEAVQLGAAGSSVWTAMVAGAGSVKESEDVFSRMLASGVEPSANTWISLMSFYQTGFDKESVIMRMAASGMCPNSYAWSSCIAAYVHSHPILSDCYRASNKSSSSGTRAEKNGKLRMAA